MPTTLRNTDILFNDGTTQSTAATSGSLVTTTNVLNATASAAIGAVGTYAVLYSSATSDIAVNGTIAGSSLGRFTGFSLNNTFDQITLSTTALGTAQTGTWRAQAFCYRRTSYMDEGGTFYVFRPSLFLRIS